MKIGVYVGSFNPVHLGHKCVMDFLLDSHYIDKMIVIPTKEYWHKQNLLDLKHRIKMLQFYESNNVLINDTLNDKAYTYEILNALNKDYPNDELYLILGADNIQKFHLWKNVEEILKHKVIVLKRGNIKIDACIEKFSMKEKFILIKNFKNINISSTMIRENLEEFHHYLDTRVYQYIKENNLYE